MEEVWVMLDRPCTIRWFGAFSRCWWVHPHRVARAVLCVSSHPCHSIGLHPLNIVQGGACWRHWYTLWMLGSCAGCLWGKSVLQFLVISQGEGLPYRGTKQGKQPFYEHPRKKTRDWNAVHVLYWQYRSPLVYRGGIKRPCQSVKRLRAHVMSCSSRAYVRS